MSFSESQVNFSDFILTALIFSLNIFCIFLYFAVCYCFALFDFVFSRGEGIFVCLVWFVGGV